MMRFITIFVTCKETVNQVFSQLHKVNNVVIFIYCFIVKGKLIVYYGKTGIPGNKKLTIM